MLAEESAGTTPPTDREFVLRAGGDAGTLSKDADGT